MALPAEIVVEEILTRLPVGELLPFWKKFSRANIVRVARYNDLPIPEVNTTTYCQILDLRDSDRLNVDEKLSIAVYRDDAALAKRLTAAGASDYNWALALAAGNGSAEIVALMISLGAGDYNWALAMASRGGTP